MYNIILLSSFHSKCGKCNADELYRIIEKIQPEIIFEELSRNVFDVIYAEGYIPQSLEAIAIKRYLKTYQVEHIPVDTNKKNEQDIFNGYDIIAERSTEYSELFKKQLSLIGQYGYPVLNSKTFDKLFDKMHAIEEAVLSEINDSKLSSQYNYDKELHDRRETEMLRNIYNYSKQYQYNKALFICGAEHRTSITRKILAYEGKEILKLNWIFYNNQDFYSLTGISHADM